jgi:hypothetical protein
MIAWETNDPAGAELRVTSSHGEEKLVSRGASGQTEIPWIGDSIYDFRLYGASQPDTPIGSVTVKRDLNSASAILGELETAVRQGSIEMKEIAQFIAAVVPRCIQSEMFGQIFSLWERHGFHVTPVHFYQPIPDTRSLPETVWSRPSELVGIDMNQRRQLHLLQTFSKFRDEFQRFPTAQPTDQDRFYLGNGLFDGVDALVAYCMVRHFQPRLIIEVGGGFSSLALSEATAKNGFGSIICIEPFPRDFLRKGFPGSLTLIEKNVQEINLEFFSQLQSGDILFIDSSHTVKIGGDVNYLFLEVLPRLKPGVMVHVHDIFLPFEYRRDWVMDEFRFWNEQYLLQAFLSFNLEFEVVMANRYLAHKYLNDLKVAFANLANLEAGGPFSVRWGGGSFWMRRKQG